MTAIHASALVDPGAELDSSVTVGPYTVIGPHVRIGAGTTIGPHCVLEGHTTIGRDNRIFQFNSLGAIPQDKKYAGEPCELVIGDRNTVRDASASPTTSCQYLGRRAFSSSGSSRCCLTNDVSNSASACMLRGLRRRKVMR